MTQASFMMAWRLKGLKVLIVGGGKEADGRLHLPSMLEPISCTSHPVSLRWVKNLARQVELRSFVAPWSQ